MSSLVKITAKALENGCGFSDADDKLTVISGITEEDNYEKWMERYKMQTQGSVMVMQESLSVYKTTEKATTEMLIKKIREYPLENSTPMQTMLFVQELKKDIQNGTRI